MEKLLSIIIPTYNMEAYLNRCLDSLLVGELQETLDILVVNDGSKDRSSEIAHTYSDRFPNSFRVIDKPNGNYGSCINAALPLAVGKYVKVLDSDDYFDTKALLTFLERLKTIDADAVLCNFTNEFMATGERQEVRLDYADGEAINPDEREVQFYEMYSLAYRTSLFRGMDYVQTEGHSYTDVEWVFYPLFLLKGFVFVDVNLYQYQIGREGQTVNPAVVARSIGSLVLILEKMVTKFLKRDVSLSDARKAAIERYFILKMNDMVYPVELMHADTTNFEALKRLDALIKAYDADMYASFAKPFVKRYYVSLFRKGIVLPTWMRKLLRRAILILK